MAEAPIARKRPVSVATRTAKPTPAPKAAAAAPKAPVKRTSRAVRNVLEDDEPRTPNYALRLTEGLEDEDGVGLPKETSFADSLTRALEAINAAQGNAGTASARKDVAAPRSNESKMGAANWLAALDKLPPIRLPIGPAIPWRLGLPVLFVLVVAMGLVSRTTAQADAPGVQLPAQQTYPVQQEAPLFAKQQQPETEVPPAVGAPIAPPQVAQPLGVADPTASVGIDFADLGIKLVAVLALAYGSLMLLKKVGIGGAAAGKSDGAIHGVRVVSSLALAPNRSVHVIRVPGGRTLLLGATPNSVNLIADLGELDENETPDAASFSLVEALKGKLGQ